MNTPPDVSRPVTQFLQLSEGRIAFDRTGSGPMVLLVPGMGELRSSYRFLSPRLVSAGFTVVTCDLRGHGESSASFASYGDADTAGDISALLEHLGKPAVVAGNSMAAGAAVIAAADRPDLVAGLVLIGPFVRNPPNQSAAVGLAFRILMAKPWAARVWGMYLPNLYAGRRPADFNDYRKDVVAAIRRPGYGKSFSLTTRTTHAPAEAALARVSAPTLVIMGEKDPDFKDPASEAQWVAAALDGSVVMVPDTGHYPQSQDPATVGDAVVQFLTTTVYRA